MIQTMKAAPSAARLSCSSPFRCLRSADGRRIQSRIPGRPEIEKIPYDGRFTLVRLSFTTNSPMGYYYRGLPAWAHGYPNSELNLMRIVSEISALHPLLEHSTVIAPDDPQLFKYPVAYMAEADYWGMSGQGGGVRSAHI